MKFVIVGDLHGKVPNIYEKEFDALIAPGDFCSDAHKPLIFKAIKMHMKDPESQVHWYDLVKDKKEVKRFAEKSYKDGFNILKKLNSFKVPVFAVPGNWDGDDDSAAKISKKFIYKNMVKANKNIRDCHMKLRTYPKFSIIGYGYNSGPEYPIHKDTVEGYTKKELQEAKKDYKELAKEFDKLFRKAKSLKKPIIFLSHNVPFNTKLDKITWKKSPRYGYHYGSILARDMIRKHQPLICIGSHMHEHFGKVKIGKTICVNAGFGPKVNIVLEIDKGKIKKLKFIDKSGQYRK